MKCYNIVFRSNKLLVAASPINILLIKFSSCANKDSSKMGLGKLKSGYPDLSAILNGESIKLTLEVILIKFS